MRLKSVLFAALVLLCARAYAEPTVASVGTPAEGAATCTAGAPSGIQDGDLLIGVVAGLWQDSNSNASGSGWTHKHSFVSAESRISILYKYASSESGSYAFSMSGSVYTDCAVIRVVGSVDAGDPFDAVGDGSAGSSSSATAASVTTTTADTLLLWFGAWMNAGTSVSGDPSGMSEVFETTTLAAFSEAVASSGATGTRSATLSASDTWGAVLAAVKPAEGGVVATKLIFGSQPGNVVVGQTFGAFTVRAVDDDDALDEEFTSNITIALQTGEGALAGTLTRAASAGIATFDDVYINTLNTDAVIRATSDGLTAADSNEFDVTAGGEGGAGGFPSTSRLGGMLQ